MGFTFNLTTEAIRKSIYDHISPSYNGILSYMRRINWLYGVYDDESGFFITYKAHKSRTDIEYMLINKSGSVFCMISNENAHTFSQFPEVLTQYSNVIREGIMLYEDKNLKLNFENSFSPEEKKNLDEIENNIIDKFKNSAEINCREDAVKIFIEEEYNYDSVEYNYNKQTMAKFDRYLSDKDMKVLRGEKYKELISFVLNCSSTLTEEEYKIISFNFSDAGRFFIKGIDDIYAELTFKTVKKARMCGMKSVGYIDFIKTYVKKCIVSYPERINELSPFLIFLKRNRFSNSFDFYIKELDRLLNNNVSGFQFVITTEAIREKMFNYIKPQYTSRFSKSFKNIDWAVGVYNREEGIFLTKIHSVTDGLVRETADYTQYIVITDFGEIFTVNHSNSFPESPYDMIIYDRPKSRDEILEEGIKLYKHARSYTELMNNDDREKVKAIFEEMEDRCSKNHVINCEDDAYELYVLTNFDVETVYEIYNKKTVADFKKYATNKNFLRWRNRSYFNLLNEAIDINVKNEDRLSKFMNICYTFRKEFENTYDELFLKVVESLCEYGTINTKYEFSLKSYINEYMKMPTENHHNILPLIRFIKTHTTDNSTLKDVVKKVEDTFNTIL